MQDIEDLAVALAAGRNEVMATGTAKGRHEVFTTASVTLAPVAHGRPHCVIRIARITSR